MNFHVNGQGESEWREGAPSDPYSAGYRPAVQVDLRQIRHLPEGRPAGLVDQSPSFYSDPVRQCPDRSKAIEEYRKASAWEDTDVIERPKPIKGISWGVVCLIVACGLTLAAIGFGLALIRGLL